MTFIEIWQMKSFFGIGFGYYVMMTLFVIGFVFPVYDKFKSEN